MTNSGRRADDTAQALADLMRAVQRQQPQARLHEPERSVDDVVWNAVVSGHGNRFEDMRQIYKVAELLARKLRAFKALPEGAMPYAPVLLSGVLDFLWGKQHFAGLTPEMAAGWSGTLKVAAAEFARRWAAPAREPWFAALAPFPAAVDAAMKKIEADGERLEAEIGALAALARDSLARVKADDPSTFPAAMAWILGTIIQKNTYSQLDCTERYEDGLKKLYFELARGAEGAFFPWLGEGFKAVRERPLDELDRWRGGIAPKPPTRKRTKARAKRRGSAP